MSTLKSSAEHLTLNADGSGNDIKFQSNATEVAVIDQSGNLTLSGTVDGVDVAAAGALATNALPKAGGTMTGVIAGFESTGIDDNATSTEVTLTDTGLGLGTATPLAPVVASTTVTANSDKIVYGMTQSDNNAGRIVGMGIAATGSVANQGINFYTCLSSAQSERMRINEQGNVGINNSSPTQRLEINGNAQFNMYDDPSGAGGYYTTKGMQIGNAFDAGLSGGDDDRNAIVWNERGTSLLFGTNNIERMRINADGKVGIGVTPEAWSSNNPALQIGSGGVLYSHVSNGTRVSLQGNAYVNSSNADAYITTNEASQHIQEDGTHLFKVAASGTADAAISWNTAMSIDNAGRVTKPLQPAFHGYLNASVSNNNGWTTVLLNREKFDIGNNFSTSNGTFTVPVSGRYILTGHFHSQTSASYLYLAIYVGSTPLPYLDGRQSSNGTDTQLSGSVIVNLTANDAVTLAVYSNAGNFQIGGGDQRTSLAGYFLG